MLLLWLYCVCFLYGFVLFFAANLVNLALHFSADFSLEFLLLRAGYKRYSAFFSVIDVSSVMYR